MASPALEHFINLARVMVHSKRTKYCALTNFQRCYIDSTSADGTLDGQEVDGQDGGRTG